MPKIALTKIEKKANDPRSWMYHYPVPIHQGLSSEGHWGEIGHPYTAIQIRHLGADKKCYLGEIFAGYISI